MLTSNASVTFTPGIPVELSSSRGWPVVRSIPLDDLFQLQAPDTLTALVHLRSGQSQTILMNGWLLNAENCGVLKTLGFFNGTFNAVYAMRTVRSRSPATTTNISDNPNHKIHIQFRIWTSINFVLDCEIQLRFSWQVISKASVRTGPRPFSARNWITAHRKLENCQVKRNILKKMLMDSPFSKDCYLGTPCITLWPASPYFLQVLFQCLWNLSRAGFAQVLFHERIFEIKHKIKFCYVFFLILKELKE